MNKSKQIKTDILTDNKKGTSKKARVAPPKSSITVKKENSKVLSASTKKSRGSSKSTIQPSSDTGKLKTRDNIIKKETMNKKPIVKKRIEKTSKKNGTLNNKNIKSNGKGNKSANNVVKKGISLTTKSNLKNEQIKNRNIDNIINSSNLLNDNCRKDTCKLKKIQLKKLPVSATSLTAKKNMMKSNIKNDEFDIRTPVRSNSKLSSSPESSSYKDNVTVIGDLIRTPVNIVSSALRKMTRIFKN